jgi:hypothetical protein
MNKPMRRPERSLATAEAEFERRRYNPIIDEIGPSWDCVSVGFANSGPNSTSTGRMGDHIARAPSVVERLRTCSELLGLPGRSWNICLAVQLLLMRSFRPCVRCPMKATYRTGDYLITSP